jgi:hypothetical protein
MEALEKVIVARGRTIYAPHPTRTTIVGQTEDGKPKRATVEVHFKPGAEIELPRDEAKRLIEVGHVHKSGEAVTVPAAQGARRP